MEKKIADMGAPITIKERQTDRQTDRPQRDNQKHKSLRNEEFKAERGEEDAGEAEEC